MQPDPHFFGDGHRHTNVGLRIKGLFVATATADQFIPFDLSIVKHLSGQQDMCWSASIGVLCCRNRVQGMFFLLESSIQNHDVSVFQDPPHHERLDFPRKTTSNFKSNFNLLKPKVPCKEQNWQSHRASRNKLESYHRPDRIVCKGYGQPSKPQLDLFLQARSMTSFDFVHMFFVFSLSLSHLQTHKVTYLDKFVSLLRSKWTLPPFTFTPGFWGSQAPSNRWIAKSPAFLGRPGSW